MINKIIIAIFVLILLPIQFAKAQGQEDDYDIFLLIGQSNMAGRGVMLEEDKRVIEGVWLLDDKGEVVEATSPLNQYSSIRKEIGMQQINPGNSFGVRIASETSRKVLLVVNARGGTSIEMWSKGDKETPYYDEAIRRSREAMQYGQIRAILWHQGESNAPHLDDYMMNLSQLVSNLREDLGLPDLPFIAGEIAQWIKKGEVFNPMIRTISQYIPNSSYISSKDAEMLKSLNDPHFSREGELLLGERYAEKVLEMVYGR